MSDYSSLPSVLPVPIDDGAASHLAGMTVPSITLHASNGDEVNLKTLGDDLTILYVYPMTGTPGVALPEGWDDIPGARGCTPESCAFRDHFEELRGAGATRVLGLSTQSLATQVELAERLHLPYPVLSDSNFLLGSKLNIPSFEVDGVKMYRRITLVIIDSIIEKVFYPIFPPDLHAGEVLGWLRDRQKG